MKHKGSRRAVVRDLRRQLKWIEQAIAEGDSDWLEIYANQLGATAYLLITEDYLADYGKVDYLAAVEGVK